MIDRSIRFSYDNISKKILFVYNGGVLEYAKEDFDLAHLLSEAKAKCNTYRHDVAYEVRTAKGELIQKGAYYYGKS